MPNVLTSAPAVEPVTVAELQEHLSLATGQQETLLGRLITAARLSVENDCRRQLVTATWALMLDAWPGAKPIRLPLAPVQSLTSVAYYDADGAEQTWDAANYVTDLYSISPRIDRAEGVSWPELETARLLPVTVTYVAGYGDDADDVPQPLRLAILMLAAELYERRELNTPETLTPTIGYQRMLGQYMRPDYEAR